MLGSFVLGATTLEEFALALLIGLFAGAYSSIFIASPMLAVLKEREPRYRDIKERLRPAAATCAAHVPTGARADLPVAGAATAASRRRLGRPEVDRRRPPAPPRPARRGRPRHPAAAAQEGQAR